MSTERCHCGRPLHYSDPRIRSMVERLIEGAGDEYVVVVGPDGRRWRVQRHYVALHGLKSWELPSLGFEELR